jgi:uncharacterized protein YbaP (TraB family)
MTTAFRRWLNAAIAAILAAGALACAAQEPSFVAPRLNDAERTRVLAQIEAVGRRGFLYEVARPARDGSIGKRLFLYGTVHIGRAGSEPFNAPLMDALRRSRRLALEADPTDAMATQKLAMQLGQYSADDSLQAHIAPALMARARTFGEKNGMPADRVARFRPWLLANIVTITQMSETGLDPALGSELYLAGFAHGVQMPIVEVEGLEAQLRLLAGLPDALQVAQLDEALDGVNDAAAQKESLALFDLWLTGDRAAADALVADMHREAEGKVFERYFVDTLIDGRNRTMADKAENYLERPGNTFFAIGSLHLFGDHGLIREFERRGYRVVDLQPPAVAH